MTMTTKQAFDAGYSVGFDRQGWHIQRRETRGGQLTNFVLRRDYPTRKAALADLYSEMTHPDGVLRPEDMQAAHDEITAKTKAKAPAEDLMNKTIVGCLALLSLAACTHPRVDPGYNAGYKADPAMEAEISRRDAIPLDEAARPPTVAEAARSQAWQMQVARDNYSREFCSNQGTMASVTTPGINSLYAGVATQASCLDFYQRTGHLPGQGF